MKRFDALTQDEQQQAVENRLGSILDGLVSRAFRLNDEMNGNNAQAVIDALVQRSFDAGDPRLAVGWIMEADFLERGEQKGMRDELLRLARADAMQCWFQEPDDRVLFIVEDHERGTTIQGS